MSTESTNSSTNNRFLTAAIETFEKAETKKLVTALVDRYYPLFAAKGVPYPKAIRVKVMKTRHGSCSSAKGYLNFSSRLCQYAPAFVEYVVVHELCHRKEMNHSAKFWALVRQTMPDYEIWRKWLRSEGNTMIGRLPE